MDLVPVRLTAGAEATDPGLSPEALTEVLRTAATTADRLEHIRARAGPAPGTVDVVLFLLPPEFGSSADTALRLCRRAVDAAPSLTGWTAGVLGSIRPIH